MTRRGVFVTGTDTGIGKSFAAACLVSAWNAGFVRVLFCFSTSSRTSSASLRISL